MIARIWHGRTPAGKADEYLAILEKTGIADYKAVPGNKGAYILRRIEGEEAHFITLTFWDSREAIERFAGSDIEKSKYYPEDKDFLLEYEPTVTHYEVFTSEGE
jgi:heme-degrading monooxygenase HmoA